MGPKMVVTLGVEIILKIRRKFPKIWLPNVRTVLDGFDLAMWLDLNAVQLMGIV